MSKEFNYIQFLADIAKELKVPFVMQYKNNSWFVSVGSTVYKIGKYEYISYYDVLSIIKHLVKKV